MRRAWRGSSSDIGSGGPCEAPRLQAAPVGEGNLSNSDHSQTELLTGLDASRKWKRPQLGLAGVLYARIPHGHWGAGGLKAPGIFFLNRIVFGICIKQLTLSGGGKVG